MPYSDGTLCLTGATEAKDRYNGWAPALEP